MTENITIETFTGHEGEVFRLSTGPETLELRLVAVTRGGEPFKEGARVPFSLLFHGPAQPWAPQGTYTLGNEGLGEVALFVVPIGPEGDAMRYEAVFT